MRVFLLVAILAVAVGFAPTSVRKTTSSLQMAKEGFSRSLPFLLKPQNLDGMIVSTDSSLV